MQVAGLYLSSQAVCDCAVLIIVIIVTIQKRLLVGLRSQLGAYMRNCLRALLVLIALRLAAAGKT